MIKIDKLPVSNVDGHVLRIIPSRYPQINLFEQVSGPQDWEVLYAVESLTNPRLRDQVGDIRLVAPEDRVYGDGASWIMAAFTHPPVDGRGGRFNRDFGMFYCSCDQAVAIAESSYHQETFLRESKINKITLQMRIIRAHLGPTILHDLRHLVGHALFHRDDYGAAQRLGYSLRSAGSYGVHYPSVRANGECFGIMRPRALSDALHWRYLSYHYNKGKIVEVESIEKWED